MTDEKMLKNAVKSCNKDRIEEVFNYLYDKYKPLVIFVASKYIKRIDDIDDIVQDTFISFFNNISFIKTNIKSYLTTIAKNKAIDFIRKNQRIDFVDDIELDNYSEDRQLLCNDTFKELIDKLNKVLGKEDADIIIMHLVDDLKFDEIGLKYNQKVKTIKTRYYRALKKFKERNNKI